jgi:hypothetical protein
VHFEHGKKVCKGKYAATCMYCKRKWMRSSPQNVDNDSDWYYYNNNSETVANFY